MVNINLQRTLKSYLKALLRCVKSNFRLDVQIKATIQCYDQYWLIMSGVNYQGFWFSSDFSETIPEKIIYVTSIITSNVPQVIHYLQNFLHLMLFYALFFQPKCESYKEYCVIRIFHAGFFSYIIVLWILAMTTVCHAWAYLRRFLWF